MNDHYDDYIYESDEHGYGDTGSEEDYETYIADDDYDLLPVNEEDDDEQEEEEDEEIEEQEDQEDEDEHDEDEELVIEELEEEDEIEEQEDDEGIEELEDEGIEEQEDHEGIEELEEEEIEEQEDDEGIEELEEEEDEEIAEQEDDEGIDELEEEEEEPETFSQIAGNSVEFEDYVVPIPITTRTRVSSNPSSVSVQPILYEHEQQQQQQQQQRRRQQQQHEEEEGETESVSQMAENAVDVVGVDEASVEHDRRRREEGESSSSSPMKGIENEGIPKIGESYGNLADGVCCSICMEPWSSEGDHQVSCLPCGHVYGLSCIKRWIQHSSCSKCPQCNRKCGLEDVITLYVTRLAIVDGEQQKKLLSLQAENEFLKTKFKVEWEEIKRDQDEKYKRLAEQMKELIYKRQDEHKEEMMGLIAQFCRQLSPLPPPIQ